jgi:hypothetical protein
MTEHIPHEYGPRRGGHGEGQCLHCLGTNRENAIISPNHCEVRAAKLAKETPSSNLRSLKARVDGSLTDKRRMSVTLSREEWTALRAAARPVETTAELCPNCGRDEVGTFTADDSFLYGSSNPVRLVAKDVLFFRCLGCHLEYTGEDGEKKRTAAVRAHLVEPSRELCTHFRGDDIHHCGECGESMWSHVCPPLAVPPPEASILEAQARSLRRVPEQASEERCKCGQRGCSQCGEDPSAYGFGPL